MVTCVAFGCPQSTSRKKVPPGISFHRFPKDVAKRNAWKAAVRRQNWTPSSTSRLCSTHFEEKHIDRTHLASVSLREGAIPSIFPGFPPEFQVLLLQKELGCAPDKEMTVAKEMPEKEIFPLISNDNANVIGSSDGVTDVELSERNETILESPHNDALGIEECGSVSIEVGPFTNVSNSPCIKQNNGRQQTKLIDSSNPKRAKGFVTDEDTPTLLIKKLFNKLHASTERLKQSRMKIKLLQQSQSRLKKKVTSLKNVICSMKKNGLAGKKHCDMLNAISSMSGSIVNRQLLKANNSTLQKNYDIGLRSFAISLHNLSPMAYTYVRRTFHDCLPHPKTIRRWYRKVNASPGFSSEILTSEIELAGETSTHECADILAM